MARLLLMIALLVAVAIVASVVIGMVLHVLSTLFWFALIVVVFGLLFGMFRAGRRSARSRG
jgi:hypothetical protein